MNITCPHCRAKLSVPDHKIPKGKDSSFKCPKCQDKIQILASQDPSGTGFSKKEGVKPGFMEKSPLEKDPLGKDVMGPGGGAIQGQKNALVVMADSTGRSKLLAAVAGLGFTVEISDSISDALKKMDYQLYPLVVVEDKLAPNNAGAMFTHMNELDMSLRRRICLILVGDQLPTGDPMAALHASVNYILGLQDHVAQLLSTALAEHRNFYTVYNDSLRAAGKA